LIPASPRVLIGAFSIPAAAAAGVGGSRRSLDGDNRDRVGNGFRSGVFSNNFVLELVVDPLRVLWVTEDLPHVTDRVVASLALGLEHPSARAGEDGGGLNLGKALKVADGEEEVLSLDLPEGRGELVGNAFHEDDRCEPLAD